MEADLKPGQVVDPERDMQLCAIADGAPKTTAASSKDLLIWCKPAEPDGIVERVDVVESVVANGDLIWLSSLCHSPMVCSRSRFCVLLFQTANHSPSLL